MIYRHNKLPYIAPMVLQNKRIENNQHVIASSLTAGNSVDSNRTSGDVTIASGTNYSVEHTGTVSLMPGFKVEKGATFPMKPSDY